MLFYTMYVRKCLQVTIKLKLRKSTTSFSFVRQLSLTTMDKLDRYKLYYSQVMFSSRLFEWELITIYFNQWI